MPCETRKDEDGRITAIVCTKGARRQRCRWCAKPCDLLCDYPVKGKTCDAPMCRAHAERVGPNRDYCPPHVELAAKLNPPQEAAAKP